MQALHKIKFQNMKKENRSVLALAAVLLFLTPFLSSCLKTKNCNIEITQEEKSWFPYDTSHLAVFESDSGNYDSVTFSPEFNYADGEISEGSTCQASSYFFMQTTDNSGQKYNLGRYLLYKQESQGSPIVQSSISFVDLELFQNSITDSELLVSVTGNPLETIDSLVVGDTTYRNVQHISDEDTARLSFSQLKNIYFSENFRLIRYDIKSTEEVFELIDFYDNQ